MATAGSIESRSSRPYADSVRSQCPGELYDWFISMLHEDAPKDNTNPESTNPRSFVHIIDITEVFANPLKFAASKHDVVDKTFTNMLAGSPVAEGAVIRLIAVEYSRPQDLNFAFIDAIGYHLKINPNMFFLHFERSRELYAEKLATECLAYFR